MVYEFFYFENPESLAIGVFIVLFALTFSILNKFLVDNKGVNLIVALAISLIASWRLYNERFYGWETLLGFVIIVFVILFFLRIIWRFIGFGKQTFDKSRNVAF